LLKDWESINENEAQITKAISRADWFKNQGVQLYGSNMFNQIKDCAYQIF
jgi:hypothetical protein